MSEKKKHFIEVCLYEVKPDKTSEFEGLIKIVSKHHRDFPGVIDVRYMKRTHRPADFVAVKKGKPAIKLSRKPKSVTYILYWELENEVIHGKATKSGLKNFLNQFKRCLVKPPKIILGERIQ